MKTEQSFAEIYHQATLTEIADWQGADVEAARAKLRKQITKIKDHKDKPCST